SSDLYRIAIFWLRLGGLKPGRLCNFAGGRFCGSHRIKRWNPFGWTALATGWNGAGAHFTPPKGQSFHFVIPRLPLHAGVKTRQMQRAIRSLILELELPYQCRIRLLCHLTDARSISAQVGGRRLIDEDVRVLQLFDRAAPQGISELLRPLASRRPVAFVHLENGSGGIAGRIACSGAVANVPVVVQHAVVAIVEEP